MGALRQKDGAHATFRRREFSSDLACIAHVNERAIVENYPLWVRNKFYFAAIRAAVETDYAARTGLVPMVLPVDAVAGAGRIS